jgi:hypothetical protein
MTSAATNALNTMLPAEAFIFAKPTLKHLRLKEGNIKRIYTVQM